MKKTEKKPLFGLSWRECFSIGLFSSLLIHVLILSAFLIWFSMTADKPQPAEETATAPIYEEVVKSTYDTPDKLPIVEEPEEVELPEPEVEPEPEIVWEKTWTDDDVVKLAQMLWGEARGIASDTEKAACVWVVLNRVDRNGGTIAGAVTAPGQFFGWSSGNPVDEHLKDLCEDVLERWAMEKAGAEDVGRVLPADYIYFTGYGGHNHFRAVYSGGGSWDWSLESPYES